MPIILVGLAKIAYVVLPITALVAAFKGWRAWQTSDRHGLRKSLWWIAGPWIVVVLLTGFGGMEELLEDGFEGNPIILSPIIGIALLVALFFSRSSPPPSSPHSSVTG